LAPPGVRFQAGSGAATPTASGCKFIIVGTTQVFLTTQICPLTTQVFNCTQHTQNLHSAQSLMKEYPYALNEMLCIIVNMLLLHETAQSAYNGVNSGETYVSPLLSSYFIF
jgi:hypothetical protein